MTVGDLDVGSIDGSLTRVPDTPANRDAFGSAGTADGSAPFPQLRELRCPVASTRATVGVVTGPSGAGGGRDKGEAEQKLLDGALARYPAIFTPDRLWVMDRNFPGVPRIKKMPATGTHVLIRVKEGITLTRTGDLCRARTRIIALSWYFLCSSGRSPVLVDQAVDNLPARGPAGHLDRLAGFL